MKKEKYKNLFKNKIFCYFYLKLNHYKIKKKFKAYIRLIFKNELNVLLKTMENQNKSEFEFKIIKENIIKNLKNNKFRVIEELLTEKTLLIFEQRLMIYESINETLKEKIIKNDLIFFEYIINNEMLRKNHKLLLEITDLSFKINNEIIFKKFLDILIDNYYKDYVIFFKEGKYNYLEKTIKEKKDKKFLNIILQDINNIELLMGVLFALEPIEQEKLEILFKDKIRKEKILARFEEIKEKNKHRDSKPINQVKQLLNYKKINNF